MTGITVVICICPVFPGGLIDGVLPQEEEDPPRSRSVIMVVDSGGGGGRRVTMECDDDTASWAWP